MVAGLAAGAVALVTPALSSAATCAPHWVGSWAAAPSDASSGRPRLHDQTLRMIVNPHLGGSQARIRLDNRFGSRPVTLGPATVALAQTGAAVQPGSLRPVTFGGVSRVTIPAGGRVVSDPVTLEFPAFADLAVSVAVPGSVASPTEHLITRQTSFISAPGSGDLTGQVGGDAFTTTATDDHSSGWYLFSGVDVLAPGGTRAVVAIGDSITDGFAGARNPLFEDLGTLDTNVRYPDALQRRVSAAGLPLSVLNAGITSNRLLLDGPAPQAGTAGLARFGIDVAAQAGVTNVIAMEGINDLGEASASPDQLIAGYQQLIAAAHAAGLRIQLGTITPSGGTTVPTYDSPRVERPRQAVNAWIRSQRLADGVVDFDAAVRNPLNASRLLPAYDSSDHLHLNAAGNAALARAVDLGALATPACTTAGPPIPEAQPTQPKTKPRLRLRIRPTRIRTGRRKLTLQVTATIDGRRRSVSGATVRIAGRRVKTDASGNARITIRNRYGGLRRATATKRSYRITTITYRIR